MASIKSIKFDGEDIYFFRSAIYLFETSSSLTLEVNLVVTEVVLRKYQNYDNIITEIELEGNQLIHAIMHVKNVPGGLPQLHLHCDVDQADDYETLQRIHENDSWFPDIEENITLEQIREVEMPFESIKLNLHLPINQVEWLKKQKKRELNQLFHDFIQKTLKNN